MIVIVLGAVQELGQGDPLLGYQLALAIGVVAALIQIIIALLRRAVIAEIMPPAVIHGMLAAIGLIIVSKQIYVLAGIAPLSTKAPFTPLSISGASAASKSDCIWDWPLCFSTGYYLA